ncbi:hypothetical protein FOCG_18107 [Fusarium oxysporum f. sp. radicis-lycopersici 26381]|nr:hypothetical protein FOCG_18107 [Fusarium oxysporum f. sp. radicis-lycopersici 26381]
MTRFLEGFTTTLRENTMLGRQTSTDKQSCGSCKTNTTGASNDENSNRELKRPEGPASD